MSGTTTISVGGGSAGSVSTISTSGTYEISVAGSSATLGVDGASVTATIATLANGMPFTDDVFGGATEIYDPSGGQYGSPIFDIGENPVARTAAGGGTLELGNSLASDLFGAFPVTFSGTDNLLVTDPGLSPGIILSVTDFAHTDTIDLQSATGATGIDWMQNSGGSGGTLDVLGSGGSTLAALNFNNGSFTTGLFNIATDTVGGSEITVACFRAGTRIATPDGEAPVETLAEGDRVLAADGGARPIRWVGRRSYSERFAAGKTHVMPVRIRAGALGNGRPHRDLSVSPQHAMLLDGALIPAICLVNGASIVQEAVVGQVDYVHLDLGAHDVVFAEGAATESYVDDDNRAMFHNAGDYWARFGTDAPPARYCAERIEDGPLLAAIRARLAALAGGIPAADALGTLEGFFERIEQTGAGPVAVGWARNAAAPDQPSCLEAVCGGRVLGRALANLYREDLAAARIGGGSHGFRIALPAEAAGRRITIRRAADRQPLAADGPLARAG